MKQKALCHEIDRIYVYPDGFRLSFHCVNFLKVSDSGHHYLDYGFDGSSSKKAIVAPGWRCIEIHADAWD
jgi:hypothetical protein